MAAVLVLRGPDDSFRGMGEITAGKVGRRIWFLPGDVVEDFVAELLHGVADGENDVVVPVTQMVPLGFRTRWRRRAIRG